MNPRLVLACSLGFTTNVALGATCESLTGVALPDTAITAIAGALRALVTDTRA